MRATAVSVAFVLAVAFGVALGPLTAANATSRQATTMTGLFSAFASSFSGDTVVLDGNILGDASSLAIAVKSGVSMTLDLAGKELTLVGADEHAGLQVGVGTTLTIIDTSAGATGKLTVTAGEHAAGIGGDNGSGSGTIKITGGTISITGGIYGAGIGGGYESDGGTTTINGGNVSITGGESGAGIGGGLRGNGGSTTISGGTTTITGGGLGAGIGGGGYRPVGGTTTNGGTTTITGGTTTITGGGLAAGIGGGYEGNGGTTTITGGTITATGGGAGIGGGRATIGGGSGGKGGNVVIGVSATVTASSTSGVAIGPGGGSTIFGSLSNAGILTIPLGNKITIPASTTVTNSATGEIRNSGTLDGAGTLNNNGQIVNEGTLTAPTLGSVINNGTIRLVGAGTITNPLNVTVHNTTVALDGNGGTAPAVSPVVYSDTFQNGQVTFPADATRTGHTFTGWFDANTGGTKVTDTTNFGTGGHKTTTIYAQWTANPYTLTFDAQGGSSVAATTVNYGTAVSVPTAPTKTGSSFTGWATTSGGGTAWDFTTPITGDTTIYAQWTLDSFTFTFDAQGGSGVPSATVNYGSLASAPTIPTKTGSIFIGWETTAAGGTAWDFTTPITGNTTVFAQWILNSYTLTFDSQGGSSVAAQTVTYEGPVTVPTDPTRIGYAFTGWYTASTGGAAWNFATPFAANTMTYAQWTPVAPTLSLTLTLAIGSAPDAAGNSILVSGTNLLPSSTYTVTLHSTPVVLFTGSVPANGIISQTMALPAHIDAGAHTVTLDATSATGALANTSAWLAINNNGTVAGVSYSGIAGLPTIIAPDAAGALAHTGNDNAGGLLAAALLLLLGGGALAALRRQRQHAHE